MTYLVFGTTGQVGIELARQGVAEVTALSREQADLTDPMACAALILETKPKAVINAAAYTAVDRAEEEEELAHVINADAPGVMAQACADLGIPFLHVSTDYVFAGVGTSAQKPGDPTDPQNAYGRTKLAGEEAIVAAGGPFSILRTSWVVSAHGANFVKTMLRLGEARDVLTVVSDQVGGPTPAADIASTLLKMADAMIQGHAGGVFHFSGAPDTTWADFARCIFSMSGVTCDVVDIPTADYPTPARRPLNSRLDCASLDREFKLARPDWRDGLNAILKELKHGSAG